MPNHAQYTHINIYIHTLINRVDNIAITTDFLLILCFFFIYYFAAPLVCAEITWRKFIQKVILRILAEKKTSIPTYTSTCQKKKMYTQVYIIVSGSGPFYKRADGIFAAIVSVEIYMWKWYNRLNCRSHIWRVSRIMLCFICCTDAMYFSTFGGRSFINIQYNKKIRL